MSRVKSNQTEFPNVKLRDVLKLAEQIEQQLWNRFENTATTKYRSRCRSIMFNVKDEKNNGLFRKIVTGKITPSDLTGMTSDQMASKDLQRWRNTYNKLVRWYFQYDPFAHLAVAH